MKKLLLLLLIFAGASATVPSLRERVEPRVVPVWSSGLRQVKPLMRRALDPAYRWKATNEARSIALTLREDALNLLPLPSPRTFQSYLDRRDRGARRGLDPWGEPYYLELVRDSITVGSTGPDSERDSEDDIRVTVGRR